MGLSYRRSKKVGPLRFTASKKGLGVSAGGRRARVSRGAGGRKTASFSVFKGLRWFKSWK